MKEHDVGAIRWKNTGGIANGPQRLLAAVHGDKYFLGGDTFLHAKPPESLLEMAVTINLLLILIRTISLKRSTVNIGNGLDIDIIHNGQGPNRNGNRRMVPGKRGVILKLDIYWRKEDIFEKIMERLVL
jgi:hypothetical protein